MCFNYVSNNILMQYWMICHLVQSEISKQLLDDQP